MKDNIILTGFMGSGKTSVGIRLSYRMKQTMIDTDKWIEQRQKMSVSEIFAAYGEYFPSLARSINTSSTLTTKTISLLKDRKRSKRAT